MTLSMFLCLLVSFKAIAISFIAHLKIATALGKQDNFFIEEDTPRPYHYSTKPSFNKRRCDKNSKTNPKKRQRRAMQEYRRQGFLFYLIRT